MKIRIAVDIQLTFRETEKLVEHFPIPSTCIFYFIRDKLLIPVWILLGKVQQTLRTEK